MPISLYSLLLMDSNDLIMAAGFGACCTLLMALRKGRPFSLVLGWALAGFGMGFYFGAWLAKQIGVKEPAGAFAVSFSALGWAPWLIETLPKWLDQKLGVATDNDALDLTSDSDRPPLFEREDTSHDS